VAIAACRMKNRLLANWPDSPVSLVTQWSVPLALPELDKCRHQPDNDQLLPSSCSSSYLRAYFSCRGNDNLAHTISVNGGKMDSIFMILLFSVGWLYVMHEALAG